MKKAFTLIELLVVIAIIAILAAILFPVFAQAKASAKKTSAVSNQKQISLAILQYAADYDDLYPRNDDCVLNSSLNQALNIRSGDPSPYCNGSASFAFRMNHYSWQKWALPYTKNVQIFEHPGRAKRNDTNNSTGRQQWSVNGQIMGGFALNLALTGAVNTWGRNDSAPGRLRNSWLGGSQTSIPSPSEAMLLFEFSHPDVNFAPVAILSSDNGTTQTVYPAAYREFWGRIMNKWSRCSGANMSEISNEPDPRSTFAGGVVVGFADGSAKFISNNRFLARTPLAREYGPLNGNNVCGQTSGVIVASGVNLNINYPMWGLTQ